MVHVRAYTQNRHGHAVQVSDDDRPGPVSPIPNPKIHNDRAGGAEFGATRKDRNKKEHVHQGIDIEAKPGDPVFSSVDGKIRTSGAYKDGSYPYLSSVSVTSKDRTRYLLVYVSPEEKGRMLAVTGQDVTAGTKIGFVQDRASLDTTGKMHNHIHLEIHKNGKPIDPTPYVLEWQRGGR